MSNFLDQCYEQFSKTIEERRLFEALNQFLILYSFGKDCTMMMDLFFRYYQEHSLSQPVSVFTVPYPTHMYFAENGELSNEVNRVIDYWDKRGVTIKIEAPACEDLDFNDKFGCKTCKAGRKPILDRYINSFQGNTGILTGFTLYDALAYLTMLQLTCNYDIKILPSLEEPLRSTTSKMLHKMSLREHLPNGKFFIRPMLTFNEQDVHRYIDMCGLPHATAPCMIYKYKFKRMLSKGLDLYNDFPVTYEGVENFLKTNGISLNDGGLSFEDVENDNFFIDC